jgi:D-alanine-D-alanine ligase
LEKGVSQHVAVLMGGWSAEREVSLRSGEACAKAAESEGFRVTRVDADRNISATLKTLKPDVVLNALHGPVGEDGTIQGILEVLQIPYTHSGVLASALALEKDLAKTIMAAAGVPVAHGVTVPRLEAARHHILPPPYVVKPVNEGSSFGVIIVKEERSHPPQELIRPDWPYGDRVLVEKYVGGRELTCAVMGDKVLDIIEILPSTGAFYDYDAKYAEGGSIHVLPAQIKPNIYRQIQQLTLTAHQALGCRGVSRADFRWDDRPDGTGELACLEVNTQPGMTATSLVPELAQYAGLSFGKLIRWMVEDASCDR